MGDTIWAITLQALPCRKNSHKTPKNSQDFHQNSQKSGEIAKTPIKTPKNSHWATDYFCRPFFMRNFAVSKDRSNKMLNLRFVRSHEGSPDADHTSRKA